MQKEQPLISVIVPIYNVDKWLNQCVDSIIEQTYSNLEIILIDDGSTDFSPKICDDYAKKDKRVRVIHKENGGLSSARNAGLDIASGDLLAFVDSDDWIDRNTYSEMLKEKENKDVTIVCCAGQRTDGRVFYENCLHNKPSGTVLTGTTVVKEMLRDQLGSQVIKGLYEKECWHNLRFPLGRLYEDIPTTYHAFEKAENVAFIDEPFYKYRINNQGISLTPNPLKSYHIFLGFREHFNYALAHYPDIAPECCTLAAQFAISTYFHYCTDGEQALKPYADTIRAFLIDNKKTINYKDIKRTRRLALKTFFFSEPIFRYSSILYYSGINKIIDRRLK